MLLRGKKLLITGVSAPKGIGRAALMLALDHGAQVIALDCDAHGLSQLKDIHPGLTAIIQCDLSARNFEKDLLNYLDHDWVCDGIIHCAAIAEPMSLSELNRERYDKMLDINLWGTLQLLKQLTPFLVKSDASSIVCLSSLAAERGGGFVGGLHYTASKAAMLGVVKSLARELSGENIRVNAVCPGLVDTDMTSPYVSKEQRAEMAKQALFKRMARPEEVAGVCIFLVSNLSTYITGATIDVNGGLHIH